MKKLLLLFSLIVLICCPISLAFDKEQGKFKWTDEVWDLSLVVTVQTIVGKSSRLTGIGTVIEYGKDFYVITAAHVLEKHYPVIVIFGIGVCPATVVLEDHEMDIAILRIPKDCVIGRFAGIKLENNTGILDINDAIVTVLRRSGEYVVKTGVVRTAGKWFETSIDVEYGDSGAPVFVFLNGKPLFIGIMRARVCLGKQNCFSQAVRVPISFIQAVINN